METKTKVYVYYSWPTLYTQLILDANIQFVRTLISSAYDKDSHMTHS
jgi:hypothetical protein